MMNAWRYGSLVMLMIISSLLSGCQEDTSTPSTMTVDSVHKADQGWPRTLMTVEGPVTLEQPPKRIVSTSVTLTGTLIALDAPVVASGATTPNTEVANAQGFFRQWSEQAKSRGIKPLYTTQPDAEAIVAANPDLIVIAATGADSALALYQQLQAIAPTVVVHYDDKNWMTLTSLFGDFLGLEQQAKERLKTFEENVAYFKANAILPPQPTTAMVYYKDNTGANIWTQASAQGQILSELGFNLAPLPESVKGDISMGERSDIIIVSGERFPDAVTGHTALLFSAESDQVSQVMQNDYLSDTAPVLGQQIYAVGNDTFRMDYYSASNLVERLSNYFVNDSAAHNEH